MHPILRFATQVVRNAGHEVMVRAAQAPASRAASTAQQEYFRRTHDRFMRSITRLIQRSYPEHEVCEFNAFSGSSAAETRWFIEPIDGRLNFMRRVDQFCSMIAITHQNRLRYGLIVDHFRDGNYHATLDEGCFSNDGRMRTSDTRSLQSAVVACDDQLHLSAYKELPVAERISGCLGIDIANTASGRFDAVCVSAVSEGHFQLARLFNREAGGFATALDGGEYVQSDQGLVAGNTFVQRKIVSVLAKHAAKGQSVTAAQTAG
ncbi:MAG: hypothetical protein F4W90_11680 [Gammaproteobacteria bacterium]|nr:hypothetical protein [Gammaproteobacteria bacterium]